MAAIHSRLGTKVWGGAAAIALLAAALMLALPTIALGVDVPAVTGIVGEAGVPGSNIVGADVEGYYQDGEFSVWDYASTGMEGYQLHVGGPAQTYHVGAYSGSEWTSSDWETVVFDGVTTAVQDLELHRKPLAFTGRVVDADNDDAVRGAHISASYYDVGTDSYYSDYANSDYGDGGYELYLQGPAADYTLSVWADRYADSEEVVAAFDGTNPTTQDFALQPIPAAFTGYITDAGTQDPLWGAWVSAMYSDGADVNFEDYASTEEEGYYELYPGVHDATFTYSMKVGRNGYLMVEDTADFDGANTVVKDFELTAYPVAFEGTVVDADTEATLESAEVTAEFLDPESGVFYSDYYSTLEDGAYRLHPGPAGTYTVTVVKGRYEKQSEDIDYDGLTSVVKNFQLQSNPVAVQGTVFDGDTGLELGDVYVEAYYYDEASGAEYFDATSTSQTGQYWLRPGPAVTYRVYAAKPQYSHSSEDVTYDGLAPVTHDITLQPNAVAFEGTVRDADTLSPITGASVSCYSWNPVDGNEYYDEYQTEVGGTYTLKPGGPAGTFELYASRQGYGSTLEYVYFNGSDITVQDLLLEPMPTTFYGTVSNAATTDRLESASVSTEFYDDNTGSYYEDYTETGVNGEYALRPGGPAGTYYLSASKQGFDPVDLGLAYDGSTPVAQDFELQPLVLAFEGIVTDAATHDALAEARVSASFYDDETGEEYWDFNSTGDDGSYKLYFGNAAVYTLQADHDSYVPESDDVAFDGSNAITRDFALVRLEADAFEPDNTALTANPILVNTPAQSRTLFPAQDKDWVALSVQAGVTYSFYSTSLGDSTDTYFYLYEDDGVTLITSDDDGAGSGVSSRINWTPSSDQQVRLKVQGFGTNTIGPYELGVVASNSPVAADDDFSVAQDGMLLVQAPGVLLNDSDLDGDTLTCNLYEYPLNGSLDFFEDGGFMYAPEPGFSGTDWFTYEVQDAWGNTSTAVVNIQVLPVEDTPGNDAPIALDDQGATLEDSVMFRDVLEGVLANDVDPDGDPIIAEKVSDPAYGGVVLNADGSYIYTPALGFSGTDTFSYRAKDPSGLYSEEAIVSITVLSANDAPTAVADTGMTFKGVALTKNAAAGVLANDSDPENGTLTAEKVTDPAHGTVALNADGSYTYTPDADFNGADSFTYKAKDPSGAYSGVVAVTIFVDAAPVAVADTGVTSEDVALTMSGASGVLANDTDADSDTLTAEKVTDPAHGTVALSPSGSYNYTPEADYHGTDSFTYKAKDPSGAYSGVVTVTITVTAVNDAPGAVSDTGAVAEDGQLVKNAASGVLANDTDVDDDALIAVKVADPAHGTVTLNADGSYEYAPEADFNGTDSFTYKAKDPGGAYSGVVTVTITVTAVNDAPGAVADTGTTSEDVALNAAPGVLANDTDVDADMLTAEKVSDPAHGTVALSPSGSYNYTPNADYYGTDSFTYKAKDASGAYSGVVTVTITVTAVNDAPEATADAGITSADVILAVDVARGVLANDTDADADTLTAEKVADPAHGAVTLNADGSYEYTPEPGYSGPDSFTYRAKDPSGAYSSAVTVAITINAGNTAPTAANDTAETPEDVQLSKSAALGLLKNVTDVESGVLMVEKVSGPTNGTLELKADGSYTYMPSLNFHGTDSFTYKAKDAANAYSEAATVTITVASVNDAPTGTGDPGFTSEDVRLVKDAANGVLTNDSDVEAGALTALKLDGPAHGGLELKADGSYTYTPNPNFNGVDSFTYKAVDGEGAYSTPVTVSITVAEATDPTALVLTSADKTLSVYGASYTLTGRLTAVENGVGLGGRSVVVQSSKTRTGVFTDTLTVAVTAADGSFQVALKPPATTYYRVRFSGDAPAAGPYNASQSAAAVRVTPQASVGAPIAPATMYTTKAAKVYGSLKARHTAGTYPVRIYKWRYVSGKWKPMGYVKAKASNYSTYSRYSASVKLAYKGKWKLKAYHVADAGHPAKWSAKVDYVTVK